MLPSPERNEYPAKRDRVTPMPSSSSAPRIVVPRAEPLQREHLSNEIWNLPNGLTLLRIFLVPFLVVVLLTKFTGREFVGLSIFLVAAITDFFDGWLARRQGKVTRLGTLLDPI